MSGTTRCAKELEINLLQILLLAPNLRNLVVTSTRAMYQTPRTPHARDNASLDPGQDADDADRENDDLYGDENVDTGREQEAPPTGKRGRSPNWLPCELCFPLSTTRRA